MKLLNVTLNSYVETLRRLLSLVKAKDYVKFLNFLNFELKLKSWDENVVLKYFLLNNDYI